MSFQHVTQRGSLRANDPAQVLGHAGWRPVRLGERLAESTELAFITCTAVTLVCHALATWAVARTIAATAAIPAVQEAVIARSGDAVYGRLTLALVGNIQARGFGDWLAVVFTSASSVVGVQLVRILVDLSMMLVGAMALSLSLRRPHHGPAVSWPLTAAAVWLAYTVGATLRLSWTAGSGGEMVLSMLATKLLGLDSRAYDFVTGHAAFSLLLDALLVALTASVGAGGAHVLARHRGSRPWVLSAAWRRGRSGMSVLWIAAAVALVGAWMKPGVAFERSATATVRLEAKAGRAPGAMPDLPSVVTIAGTSHAWKYVVNGQAEIIHGIGYNAATTGETRDQRAARYDLDFASMSAAGVNTIAGWTEGEFDDLLMRKAAEHGLGVILPFHIGPTYVLSEPDYAYEDPRVRQQLLDAISTRVEHYRNSPALRMWGLGNEVLHAISWAHGSPAHAQAFAEFLVQAADRVHQLDPNHPVIYRDAEDWYVEPVIQALAANPKPRPWLVYGMNFFTTRLQSALDSGPVNGLNQPLLISEFGPVGLRAEARPTGYLQLWDIIRDHPGRVLGGSAYAWTTAGPEPGDRAFGLTDAQGQPVDGSLAELTALYDADQQAAASLLGAKAPSP